MASTFSHQGFTLTYHTWGNGPKAAIAFHGFGGTGADFQPLVAALQDELTIHAMDIFFHGGSHFPEGRSAEQPITPAEFTALIRAFMDAQRIDKALMLGFSLGGRLALSCIEQLSERCSGLWLFAPDGLVRYPWYRAASKWGWGRSLYRTFVAEPLRVHWLMDTARSLRLITARRHQFLKVHTEDEKRRKLVYDVWLSLRLLEPDLVRVGNNLRAHDLHALVILGRNDRVILASWGQYLKRQAPQNVEIEVLDAGHKLVTKELGERLAKRER